MLVDGMDGGLRAVMSGEFNARDVARVEESGLMGKAGVESELLESDGKARVELVLVKER